MPGVEFGDQDKVEFKESFVFACDTRDIGATFAEQAKLCADGCESDKGDGDVELDEWIDGDDVAGKHASESSASDGGAGDGEFDGALGVGSKDVSFDDEDVFFVGG